MNLPEIQENYGTTSKYHEYSDSKYSCCIAVVFVAEKLFLQTGHVFFSGNSGTIIYNNRTINLI